MKKKAKDYFNNGYSCSESVVKAAIDEGLCEQSLFPVATVFSGGMGSGCLCGAVAGAQMVLGFQFGKDNVKGNKNIARAKAKELMDEFKKKHKTTCCRALSGKLDGAEKRQSCSNLVYECSQILEEIALQKV